MNRMARVMIMVLVFLVGGMLASAAIKLDLKTHLQDKVELVGIKQGVIHYLQQEGFSVVEGQEDFCVWLEGMVEKKIGPERFECRLKISITEPSLFRKKRPLAQKEMTFAYTHDSKLLSTEDSFWKLIREKVKDIKEREIIRAYYGGRAIAPEIKTLIHQLTRQVEKIN